MKGTWALVTLQPPLVDNTDQEAQMAEAVRTGPPPLPVKPHALRPLPGWGPQGAAAHCPPSLTRGGFPTPLSPNTEPPYVPSPASIFLFCFGPGASRPFCKWFYCCFSKSLNWGCHATTPFLSPPLPLSSPLRVIAPFPSLFPSPSFPARPPQIQGLSHPRQPWVRIPPTPLPGDRPYLGK